MAVATPVVAAEDRVVVQMGGGLGTGSPQPALSDDGTRLALGDWGGYVGGEGSVKVVDWNGIDWVPVGEPITGEHDDATGRAVALSGDGGRLAVGAPNAVGAGVDGFGNPGGTVRVFDWDGSTWVQAGADIDGEAAGDRAADAPGSIALSRSGDRIAIGASGNDGAGENTGHVRVFDWDGANWVQVGTDIDGRRPGIGEALGLAVALSADGNLVAAASGSRVQAFVWDDTDWVPLGIDVDGGWPIDLSADGRRLATLSGSAPTTGVHVYDWDGTAWASASDGLGPGGHVALSDDGSRLVVGEAWAADAEDGRVRVYDWNGTEWVQAGADVAGTRLGTGSVHEGFGYLVAVSGDGRRFAAGTAYDDGSMNGNGARAPRRARSVDPPRRAVHRRGRRTRRHGDRRVDRRAHEPARRGRSSLLTSSL